ncbi:hypothetical protein O181_001000 [Austropuccinia psidii MF-1]|uniref:Uncharacterized protein n=1 Tax=Austropuccinia psidii MF-1 TaxID=1389203 RepID=A0A9Q3B9V9_9BASI|nr:hypothetical protein [Austropuccinia psidii MF-1]
MSALHLRNLSVPRNQPEDRKFLFRSRRQGLFQHGEWQDTQPRGLERYVSSTSAAPITQRPVPIKNGKQEDQLALHWEELEAGFQTICLREISFKDLMEITKGWNPNKQFKLLQDREDNIRENHSPIQAIGEKWTQKEHTLTPSSSQGDINQPSSPVVSNHS